MSPEQKPPAKHCDIEPILKLLFAGAVCWAVFLFVAAWLFKENAVLQATMAAGMTGFLTALGVKMQPGVVAPKPDTKTVTVERTDTTNA